MTPPRKRKPDRRDPTPPPRPVVTLDPGLSFGRPTVSGVPVYALVGMLLAGDDAAKVADEFGVGRRDLLVACWFEARYGGRFEWAGWLGQWEDTLWLGTYDEARVPLPTEPAGGGTT